MKRVQLLVPLLGAVAALAPVAGCGDEGATCGAGTTEQNGTCVPTNTTTCGTGTVLMGGQCVPDGSVICEQGTTFDTSTGKCEVDPSACADGTVFVEGECVPEDDTLTADLDEAAEPNDATGAGLFDVPAVNAMTSIHGCITPRGGVADEDAWIMSTSGPALVEITADGVGGLAAGFVVVALDIDGLDSYQRYGLNLTGDTSKRQVYLPAAGDYLLVMADSRSLLAGGEASGNADTCYFTTIKQVALPTATPATLPQTTGEDSGNVRVLSLTADADGDIFNIEQSTTSETMSPAFVVMKAGAFYGAASPVSDPLAGDLPPLFTIGGLNMNDVVTVVVDNEFNYGFGPQPYALDFIDLPGQRLNVDGTVTAVQGRRAGTDSTNDFTKFTYLFFDVATAGEVVHFDLTSSVPVDMRLARRDIIENGVYYATHASIDALGGTGRSAFQNEYVRFRRAGRYYLIIQNPASSATVGQAINITARLTTMTQAPVTYGTPLTNQALPAQGAGFHTLDLTATTWIQAGVPEAANWGTSAKITFYDLTGEGWLNNNYAAVQTAATVPTDGTNPLQRITLGDMRDYLVRVESNGTAGAGPTYALDIKTRPHAILGTAEPATPITRTGMDDLAAGASKGFIVFGNAGHIVTTEVTPSVATVDISLQRRNVDNSVPTGGNINAGAAGAAERLIQTFAATPNYSAFTVTNVSTTESTNLAFNVTAVAPRPYTITTGSLAFSDACSGGTVIDLTDGEDPDADEGFSDELTLPAAFANFQLFGEVVGNRPFTVLANGWMTFNTPTTSGYNNGTIPSATEPNGMFAPFWDDLDAVEVCRKDGADTVTIQWTGELYGQTSETVAFQVVMHTSGVVDFIYGANHLAAGNEVSQYGANGATVGAENLSGSFGHQILNNTAGIAPSSSRTLTPQ